MAKKIKSKEDERAELKALMAEFEKKNSVKVIDDAAIKEQRTYEICSIGNGVNGFKLWVKNDVNDGIGVSVPTALMDGQDAQVGDKIYFKNLFPHDFSKGTISVNGARRSINSTADSVVEVIKSTPTLAAPSLD